MSDIQTWVGSLKLISPARYPQAAAEYTHVLISGYPMLRSYVAFENGQLARSAEAPPVTSPNRRHAPRARP
ncbi:MAG: hypothetical protein ACYS5V_04205 [Planctomycetota bacterium]|jgi:hypothetical protein